MRLWDFTDCFLVRRITHSVICISCEIDVFGCMLPQIQRYSVSKGEMWNYGTLWFPCFIKFRQVGLYLRVSESLMLGTIASIICQFIYFKCLSRYLKPILDSEINCSNRKTGHPSNYDAKCECLHIEPYDYDLVDCDCNKEYPIICKRYGWKCSNVILQYILYFSILWCFNLLES